MAHQFGIDRGHISEIENGKKNVCLPLLEVLADGFGIIVSELMRGVGIPNAARQTALPPIMSSGIEQRNRRCP